MQAGCTQSGAGLMRGYKLAAPSTGSGNPLELRTQPTCVQHRPQIHRRVCSTGSNLKSMLTLTAPSTCSSTLHRPRTQPTCVQHRPQTCVENRVRHETVPQETTIQRCGPGRHLRRQVRRQGARRAPRRGGGGLRPGQVQHAAGAGAGRLGRGVRVERVRVDGVEGAHLCVCARARVRSRSLHHPSSLRV
jgi:hypothetical protein